MPEKQTLGEARVRKSFNPSANENVEKIKSLASQFIDLCEQLKHDRGAGTNPEEARLWALAQTHAEDAAMWAVKAVTTGS